jgi:hypothetical protein
MLVSFHLVYQLIKDSRLHLIRKGDYLVLVRLPDAYWNK